jgi:hypothetical protein
MRYIVIARDGTDPEAKARRLAARPAHLERVGPFVERGRVLLGGAILDEAGDMVGSVVLADSPRARSWTRGSPRIPTSPAACGRRSRSGTSVPPSALGYRRTDAAGERIRPG